MCYTEDAMRYKELKINTGREYAETVQAVLIEAGFTSMQIDDPLDALDIAEHKDLYKYDYINDEIAREAAEAGSGDAPVVITLFFTDDEEGLGQLREAERILGSLRSSGAALNFDSSETGDDSEWLYKWQEHFKPTRVGGRIVVKPGWEDYSPEPGDLVIEMDPGMAFGSGLHETTSMCVKALEKVLAAADPGKKIKVLDVGTGTGILAMAAVLLGADEAFGIDIDEEAVRVSKENIAKNGMTDRIRIEKGNLIDGVDYGADIIVANLMADLVMMLSPAAAAQIKPGGIYITSGILDVKEETVKQAVKDAGFDIIEVLADGEWRAIVAAGR